MRLTDDQLDLFYDCIHELVLFTNKQLHVVKDLNLTETQNDPFIDAKMQLVLTSLWQHPQLIDEFIAQHTSRLSSREVALMSSWHHTISGDFWVMRAVEGGLILMHESGIYQISGIDQEFEEYREAEFPTLLTTTLIALEQNITYDGCIHEQDIPSSLKASIIDEFERRVSEGIAVTGDELTIKARLWSAQLQERSFSSLMSSVMQEENELLPAGFTRSPYRDMPHDEAKKQREEALKAYTATLQHSFVKAAFRDHAIEKAIPDSYEEMIGDLPDDVFQQVVSLSESIVVHPLEGSREELVHACAEILIAAPYAALYQFAWLQKDQVESLVAFCDEGRVSCSEQNIDDFTAYTPCIPYVFLYRQEETYTFVIPEVMRVQISTMLDAISDLQQRISLVNNFATAVVLARGIVNLDEAASEFVGMKPYESASEEDFHQIVERGALLSFPYKLYTPADDGQTYLVHTSLSPQYIARSIMEEQAEQADLAALAQLDDFEKELLFDGEIQNDVKDQSSLLQQQTYNEVYEAARAEIMRSHDVCRVLIEMHEHMPAKALSREILEQPERLFLEVPAVEAYRQFLLERVPDTESDPPFVDAFLNESIICALETGSVQSMFQLQKEFKIDKSCTDAERPKILARYVYRSLPCWDYNGYSRDEFTERLTGKKVFYHPNGDAIRVNAGDDCPCGSGFEYGFCHGAL